MDKAIKRRLEELEASMNNKTPVFCIKVVYVSSNWAEDETPERPSHDRKEEKNGRAA